MKKVTIMFLYASLCGIVVILVVLFTCNRIITANADGKLYSDVAAVPQSEVGLLLGTTPRTRIGNRPNLFYRFRIEAAEALYKAGKIKTILVSGAEDSLDGVNEVESMRDSLVARGIPTTAVVLDGKGLRTLDSVVRATKVYGKHSYIVISQKFHNERAIYLAEHSALDVHGLTGFNALDVKTNTSFLIYVREYFARVKVFVDLLILPKKN